MLVHSVPNLSFLCLWLSSVALAQQRECDRDGELSFYNQSRLIIPFNNLCGKNITAALDYGWTPEQRRSDCIDRCVKQAPLCYGFNYTPYIDPFQANCVLMKDLIPASNVTEAQGFVADAAKLDPDFLAQLPDDCKSLGLRGCFEKYGHLGNITAGLATPTASLSASTTPGGSTTAPPSTGEDQQQKSRGLSTGDIVGISLGSAAFVAILNVGWCVLKRVKRKRAIGSYNTVQQSNNGNTHPPHKAEAATGRLELASISPGVFEANAEPFHEIEGCARHEL